VGRVVLRFMVAVEGELEEWPGFIQYGYPREGGLVSRCLALQAARKVPRF
jgi:hypothetical protein